MQRWHSSPVLYFSPMMESQTYFLASTGSPGSHSVCPSVCLWYCWILHFMENTSSCLFLFYQRTYSSGLSPKINKNEASKRSHQTWQWRCLTTDIRHVLITNSRWWILDPPFMDYRFICFNVPLPWETKYSLTSFDRKKTLALRTRTWKFETWIVDWKVPFPRRWPSEAWRDFL